MPMAGTVTSFIQELPPNGNNKFRNIDTSWIRTEWCVCGVRVCVCVVCVCVCGVCMCALFFALFIVHHYLCLFIVLFLRMAIWPLTGYVNRQALN